MKQLLLLLLFFPLLATAQLDFESYRGKLNFVDLPPVENVVSNPFLEASPTTTARLRKLPSFRLNKNNFRESVSFYDAMMASESYVKSNIEVNIDPREYGVYGGNSRYAPDANSKVTNTAYREATRGFLFADSCPPYGICPRCAPYRLGRY